MLKIEKDVPFQRQGVGRPTKWPFRDMAVGDSFVAPAGPTGGTENSPAYAAASSYQFRNKDKGVRFACRKIPDRPGMIRIWRIE